jgi:hypothetical protein
VLHGPDGKVEWQLHNKDFHPVAGSGKGAPLRLPARTELEQPREKADLRVRWEKQEHGVDLPDDRFTMAIPAGLP